MLGRAEDGARLSAALDAGRSVLVIGSAGVGKTTLVESVVRRRPHVLGGAVAGLRWRPFLPLMRAIGTTLEGDVDTVASSVLVAVDGRVLVVDDLHWADRATIDVLGLLVGRVPVVATSRPPADAVPWSDKVGGIELGPLSTGPARRLARRLHPGLRDPEVDRLVELAGGIPLLVRHLVSEGVPTPTLRAALAARMDGFDPSVRAAITEIAVHGRPLDTAVLEVAANDLADELVEIVDGRATLRHPMLAEAALESLDEDELRQVQLRLARRLPAAEAAEHYLAAGASEQAAQCARDGLLGLADPVLRAHLLSIAADATGDDSLRLAAAAALVTRADWQGAHRHAAAVTSVDPLLVAEAALHRSRACWFAGDPAEARRAAEAGIAALAGREHPLLARLNVEVAHQRVRVEEAGRATAPVARAALEVAERLGVDVPRARNVLATSLAHDGLPGWEEAYRAVIPEAAAAGDTETECSAAYFLASHLGFAGRFEEAIALLDPMIDRATVLGELTWRDHMTGALLTDLFMAGGQPERVAADGRRFVDAHPLFRNRAQIELAIALSLGDLGRFEVAARRLAVAMSVLTSVEDRSILLAAATELSWMSGDLERTIGLAEEAAGLGPGWFGITAGAVAAAAIAGFELDRPVRLALEAAKVPIFATFALEIEAFGIWSEGDTHRAIETLDRAVERWSRVGPQRYLIRAQWAAGAMAARADEPSARGRLEAAHEAAVAAQLSPVAGRGAAPLRDLEQRATLSPRETEVLRLVEAGLTSREIAGRLAISRATVESHVTMARRKLGARTRRHAVSLLERRTS